MSIKLHQLYKSRVSALIVEVIGKKGGKFKTRILTSKYGVYAGTHTLSEQTIAKQYELLDKKAYKIYE